jgi:hypothetical protein
MNSWVDTTLVHDNIWLVLVFHGVDGLGYEALPHELLDTYFQKIKRHEADLWIATFSDVAKYMRERMHATLSTDKTDNHIMIQLQHSLDANIYNIPLTLKTYVPGDWKKVNVKQDDDHQQLQSQEDSKGKYILYHANPNKGIIELSKNE